MELSHADERQQEVLGGQWRVEENRKRRPRPVGGRKSLAWCVQKEVKLGPDDRGPGARPKKLTWSMEKLAEEQTSGRTAGRRVRGRETS